jgi:hypothetical protein
MPANLPTIETLDADGLEEFLADQLSMTEQYGEKLDFEKMVFEREQPAEKDNLKYFRLRSTT